MKLDMDQAAAVLERTPGAIRAMLGGLDESWTHARYGQGTFSPFDVVGHLIHGERTDWMSRLAILLEHGESRPFDAFDRYAMYEESRGRSLAQLLDTFAELRGANLKALAALHLAPDAFSRRGHHPALGPVTLGQLLSTWVVHDLNHLAQIARAMAWQYKDEVGAWKEYLPILPR